MKKQVKILAIETSCDETAVAILVFNNQKVKILSEIVSSQVETHAKFGGVVPEVAARMHIEHILPIVNDALNLAKLSQKDIDAIAMTGGPGLITSLLIGSETAKTLAYAWDKPLINVNHIESHIYSSLINEKPKFPSLSLIVSGGHTDLIYMKNHGDYERIGGTRDDAVGEAFDKVAKMMKLGYPGGPIVSQFAEKFQNSNKQISNKLQNSKFKNQRNLQNVKEKKGKTGHSSLITDNLIILPRPMINSGDFEMSFSGIKTSVLYTLQKIKKITPKIKVEMSYEFQEAVTDVLVYKTVDAAKKLSVKSIIMGGGVSANKRLREKLQEGIELQLPKVKLYLPALKYTGDNAVMVGVAAYQHYLKKDFIESFGFRADPNWELV